MAHRCAVDKKIVAMRVGRYFFSGQHIFYGYKFAFEDHARISLLGINIELLGKSTAGRQHNGRYNGHTCAVGMLQYGIHNIFHAVLSHLYAANRRNRMPDTGKKKPEVIIYFSRRANGGTRIAGVYFLLYRYGRRQSLYPVAFGLVETAEKLTCICRQALYISPLPLGIERVECQRRLAGAGQTGDDDETVAGQFNIDIFQVVDPRALYNYIICHKNVPCKILYGHTSRASLQNSGIRGLFMKQAGHRTLVLAFLYSLSLVVVFFAFSDADYNLCKSAFVYEDS